MSELSTGGCLSLDICHICNLFVFEDRKKHGESDLCYCSVGDPLPIKPELYKKQRIPKRCKYSMEQFVFGGKHETDDN